MKKLLLSFFLFVIAISAKAQGVDYYIEMGKDFVEKPKNIDTNYVYQYPPRLSLALTGKIQQVGFMAYSDFKLYDVIPGSSVSYLDEGMYKKIGLEASYGGMSLGFDVQVGVKSATKRRSLAFGIQNLKWGVRVRYFGIKNHIINNITIGNPGDDYYTNDIKKSSGLGNLRNLSIDGYWMLNHRKFSYTATNIMNVVQKHTAGSFMLGARFMWSDLDTKEDLNGLFEAYSAIQFAIGGGYSANIVLWNRDKVNHDDRTVRNLTFNITAMPVLSLVNYLQTKAYVSQELKKSDVWCYPTPNIMGSTALSLTWGRFYYTTQFYVNWFYFSSAGAVNKSNFDAQNIHIEGYDDDVITDMKIYGILYNWTISGKLFYRF